MQEDYSDGSVVVAGTVMLAGYAVHAPVADQGVRMECEGCKQRLQAEAVLSRAPRTGVERKTQPNRQRLSSPEHLAQATCHHDVPLMSGRRVA